MAAAQARDGRNRHPVRIERFNEVARTMNVRGTRLRLFLTCWVLFSLHFATDFVREHYLVVSIVEDRSFDLTPYLGLHDDIFQNPPDAPRGGVHQNANPGISMLGAIPYALTRPLVDVVVRRSLAARQASGDTSAVYNDPRPKRVQFYRAAVKRGLDVRFGLVGAITEVFCMAPLSALGVVAMLMILEGLGLGAVLALALALLYAFGTPILFRSAYLNQNLAIAVVGVIGFLALWNPGERLKWSERRRTALAGFCGGFAFLCDYSGVLLLAFLGLYAMLRGREREGTWRGAWSPALAYALGAAPPILLLWFYQFVSFGNPFYPAQHWMPQQTNIYAVAGYKGVTGPTWELFSMLLFEPRFGLVIWAPLLLLALGAPWLAYRRRSIVPTREMVFCFLIAASYLVFFSAIQFTRLQFSTGIRYLVPVIPFLFLPAAAVLVRLPRSVAYGVVTIAVAVSWSIAMVRNQGGLQVNLIHVFLEGLQLPWLSTIGRMSAQYAPWLDGRPSPAAAFLFAAALVAGIWAIRSPWRAVLPEAGRRGDA